ncbi:MAG: hypothetical protein WCI27_05610 [Candidatus Omnitrophota bacterium]
MMRKLISFFILINFVVTCVMPPQGFAQMLTAVGLMSQPGTPVALSGAFTPAHLKGMVINPADPFKFDFIINRGDEALNMKEKQDEYKKLVKYFLAALTVPDTDQWVNLSPYEKDRLIPDNFGTTEMGRDLLAQDYMLKQITSSLTNPETDLGKKFWDGVYAQAYQKFGTTDIPTDVFNKVWILPDKAVVYEKGNTVYVLEHHLKVMMESDYVAMSHQKDMAESSASAGDKAMKENAVNAAMGADSEAVKISKQVMRDVIIPVIEKEVNAGKNFAPLRQVYSGMLLACWYKGALKESILNKVYADKGKVKGIDQDPKRNQEIYGKYVQAFRQGAFNMIKEDLDRYAQEVIPRKYFSGGTVAHKFSEIDRSQGKVVPRKIIEEVKNDDRVFLVLQRAPADSSQALSFEEGLSSLKDLFPKSMVLKLRPDITVLIEFAQYMYTTTPDQGLKDKLWPIIVGLKQALTPTEEVDATLVATLLSIKPDIRDEINEFNDALSSVAAMSASVPVVYFADFDAFWEAAIKGGMLKKLGWASPYFQAFGEEIISLETLETGLKNLFEQHKSLFDQFLETSHKIYKFNAMVIPDLSDELKMKFKELALSDKNKPLEILRIVAWSAIAGAVELPTRIQNVLDYAKLNNFGLEINIQDINHSPERLVVSSVDDVNEFEVYLTLSDGNTKNVILDQIRSIIRKDTGETLYLPARISTAFNLTREQQALLEKADNPVVGSIVYLTPSVIDFMFKLNSTTATLKEQEIVDVLKKEIVEKLDLPVAGVKILGGHFDKDNGIVQEYEIRQFPGIFNPQDENSVWEGFYPFKGANYKQWRLKVGTNLTEDQVKSLAGESFSKVWQILQEVSTRYFLIGVALSRSDASMKPKVDAASIPLKISKLDSAGGIDFAQSNLDMKIKRDGVGMVLPVSQQNLDNIKIDGLVPVILSIQSAADVPLFTGTGILGR